MTHASLTETDCKAIDRSGMAGLIASWPQQVRDQLARLAEEPWPVRSAPKCFLPEKVSIELRCLSIGATNWSLNA